MLFPSQLIELKLKLLTSFKEHLHAQHHLARDLCGKPFEIRRSNMYKTQTALQSN